MENPTIAKLAKMLEEERNERITLALELKTANEKIAHLGGASWKICLARDLVDVASDGSKLRAIRTFKNATGSTLKESGDFINAAWHR